MKKVGDLFEELGFRKDGSDSVKRAFVENLVKAANQSAPSQAALMPTRATAKAPVRASAKTPPAETQLSFNFDTGDDGPETPFPTAKRNAG